MAPNELQRQASERPIAGYPVAPKASDMRQKAGTMPPQIISPRLLLRPFRPTDAPAFAEIANDPLLQRYLLLMPYPYELHHAEEALTSYERAHQARTAFYYGVTDKVSGRLVGNLSMTLDANSPVGELGYWIARAHWGKGICTEACQTFLMSVFNNLKLQRVFASYLQGNTASRHVMKKLGMREEGCFRRHVLKEGQWFDMHCMGVLKAEFLVALRLRLNQREVADASF